MLRRILDLLTGTEEQRRFARLRKEIELPFTVGRARADVDAIFSGARTSSDALEEFFTLSAARPEINEVLHRHGWVGVSGKGGSWKLKELYEALLANGAGLWVGNIYVLTACLYDPRLLAFVLDMEAAGLDAVAIASEAIIVVEEKTGRRRRSN